MTLGSNDYFVGAYPQPNYPIDINIDYTTLKLDLEGYGSPEYATINVGAGYDGLFISHGYPSDSEVTVNQDPNTFLFTNVSFNFGTEVFNADRTALLFNQQFALEGTHAFINADVVGFGAFLDFSAQSTGGFLDLERSVDYGQTVYVHGDPSRSTTSELRVDHPDLFRGVIDMGDYAQADLAGIASFVDSYTLANDVLTFYKGSHRVLALNVNDSSGGVNAAGQRQASDPYGPVPVQVGSSFGNVYLSTTGSPVGRPLPVHT